MTITKSGELVSFYTVNKAPIKHLKVYFSPKQAGEGDPSPDNIRSIEGWNNIEITYTGKNIGYMFVNPNGYLNWPEDAYYNGTSGISKKIVTPHALYGKTVRYSAFCDLSEGTNNSSIQLGIWSQNKDLKYTRANAQQTAAITMGEVKRLSPYPITLTENIDYYFQPGGTRTTNSNGKIGLFQLEFGTKSTEFEPYQGQTYNLNWAEDIGTIYGGYVDLVTGELVQTHDVQVYNGTENWSTENTASFYTASTRGSAVNATYITCSHFPSNNYLVGGTNNNCFIWTSGNLNIQTTEIEHTAQAMKNFCLTQYNNGTPLTITYSLITPIVHTLTPTQLQTLLGCNNIWSNADRVEVEYELAESNDELYRRRNILLRTPHIETAAGSIATFKTDTHISLKECKVHFAPIQEGEGTPNPENVRPITGWTEVSVYQAGKNLWPHGDTEARKPLFLRKDTEVVASVDYASQRINIAYHNQSGDQIDYWTLANNVNERKTRDAFSLLNDAYYFMFWDWNNVNEMIVKNPMIAINSDMYNVLEYEPYIGQNYTINWKNSIGTIYGGYIDLIKGKLIQEWILNTFTWGNIRNHYANATTGLESGNIQISGILVQESKSSQMSYGNTTFCNICSNIMYQLADKSPEHYYVYAVPSENRSNAQFSLPSTYPDELEIQLACKLLTPIEYDIDPSSLKALKGTNNIWSNTNGPIEIKYWTH